MIVLNAGVPRSGTVLVNAILRRIFELNGIRTAQANPHDEELPRLIRTLQRTAQDRYKTVLVHTHSWDTDSAGLLHGSPFVTGFINYRDPRDVCVSLMRLHEHDFDTAARLTLGSFQIFDAMAREADLMILPYERLVADKPGYIFQIAQRLGRIRILKRKVFDILCSQREGRHLLDGLGRSVFFSHRAVS